MAAVPEPVVGPADAVGGAVYGPGTTMPHAAEDFLNRDDERDALDTLLSDVRGGGSRVLVLRGEAGIGKTALLRHAVAQAAGFGHAHVVGVEAEMELPFAALHQLCTPVLGHLDALPGPQRAALDVALGRAAGTPPDRFLLSLATLSLLAAAAEERPLLCVVDDAQWLDLASAQVVSFVARRVAAESVALLVAVRDPVGAPQFDDLPQLHVEGLHDRDARTLLARAVAGRLDARVRDRVVGEVRGNPLALLELPRGMTAAELAGGFEIPVHGGLPSRLEDHYVQRSARLPEATRTLLLVAAADPAGDAALVWQAAQALGVGTDALLPAHDAGLLEIDTRVRFPHPLVRSALYRAATPEDRRAVHRALAHATDAGRDHDRRAWHRAAATNGPDEDVAADLERAADSARARGGLAATAAFLRRAVALTQDEDRRIDRALAAAEASMQAGALDLATDLLAVAERAPLDPLRGARSTLLRAQIAFVAGRTTDATPLYLAAAEQLAPLDLGLSRTAYLGACGAAMWAGPDSQGDLLAACRAVKALPPPESAPTAAGVLLDGIATLVTDGRAAAASTLLRATQAFSGADAPVEEGLRWGWFATAASNALWDDEGLRAVCTRQLEIVRETGALGGAQSHLTALGASAARAGDFDECAALMAEAAALADATGARVAPFNDMLVLALRGREAQAEALIAGTLEQLGELRQGVAGAVAHWSAALLYNGVGRFEDALVAAQAAASTSGDLFAAMWALPELVEAAVRTGQLDLARDAAARLAETTRPASTDFGLGTEARSRALVAEGEEAEALFHEAIERLGRTRMRADLARAHLLLGEWLRQEGRRRDAREHLRTAHELFADMGLEGFAERTRRELNATGDTVRRRADTGDDDLTAQERQIAHLAGEGLSNPEIGARLFLSPRTVEWHLRKVFVKLGVRSRRDLERLRSDG